MQSVSLTIITFPIWWYTTGLQLMLQWTARHFHAAVQKSGIRIFIRYMRYPIYGDYTRSGKLVGLFLRVVILIAKLIWLGLHMLVILGILGLYLAIIPLSIFMIIYQVFPV